MSELKEMAMSRGALARGALLPPRGKNSIFKELGAPFSNTLRRGRDDALPVYAAAEVVSAATGAGVIICSKRFSRASGVRLAR